MSRLLLAALTLLCVLLSVAPAWAAPGFQAGGATLTVLAGGVTVVDQTTGAARAGASGDTLAEGNHILTGPDGHALVTFFDGSEAELQPNTEVQIVLARASDSGTLVELAQATGTTANRVATLGADSTYQLQLPSATALVRGTKFTGVVTRSQQTSQVIREQILVDEGTVVVQTAMQTYVLPPGQQVTIDTPDGQAGQPQGTVQHTVNSGPTQPATPPLRAFSIPMGVAEGQENPQQDLQSGAGTNRILLSWAAIQPSEDTFQPDFAIPPDRLAQLTADGREIVGLIQFTPAWAARDADQGERSVPRGLGDPNGPWSRFVAQLVQHYKGRIKHWQIWNEMDFRQNDQGIGSWTWGGSEADYWLLLKDAYRAIKAQDPDATVIFGATTYWVDVNNQRELYPKRVLDVAKNDPEAAANNWFFDAIAMNVYRAPDDVYRIYSKLHDVQQSFGLDKPQWLTETNCMPWDDPQTPKPDDHQRCTLEQQAAYAIQAYAIGFAAGWQRIIWYQLTDHHVWQQQEVWGLVRDDGSQRPVFAAYQAAVRYIGQADHYTFAPRPRDTLPWGTPWPDDPNSYYPNWQVYLVVADRGAERSSVLWTEDGSPVRARIPKQGSGAILVNKRGETRPLVDQDGWYVVDLPPATIVGPADPPGYHFVGGDPFIVVQQDVPPGSPISPPELGDPS